MDDATAAQPRSPSPGHRLRAWVKGLLGWATDDRDVEAEGRAEVVSSEPADERATRRARREVADDYGETPGS